MHFPVSSRVHLSRRVCANLHPLRFCSADFTKIPVPEWERKSHGCSPCNQSDCDNVPHPKPAATDWPISLGLIGKQSLAISSLLRSSVRGSRRNRECGNERAVYGKCVKSFQASGKLRRDKVVAGYESLPQLSRAWQGTPGAGHYGLF